ncbi:MAG: helix-turn-helix transcriptional regulator [Chloroflexi bacterium]|nr:helix-turn-helix transcriptional regulator [Chloroflexota bacterium]BCY17216.1 transcriptional regulator [Leptolinea sp. HRD-7]
MTNITKPDKIDEGISELFRVIGQPVRVRILLVIGSGEACVCHLEAYLGERQAAISQHLMVLRDSGIVQKHRDGRNIYYRLARPEILELVHEAASILGITSEELNDFIFKPTSLCGCPKCNLDGAGCKPSP